jgi:hypothetical protein
MSFVRAESALEFAESPIPVDQSRIDACPGNPLIYGSKRPISAASSVRMRQIEFADLSKVADLLQLGFPDKSKNYFLTALRRLSEYEQPPEMPRFGLLLEADTTVVGALLAISSLSGGEQRRSVRCNVTCWYVSPEFRVYAPLLVSQIGRNPAVTYLNISPAAGTLRTIEAQGFCRFNTGAFAGVPVLAKHRRNVKVAEISALQGNAAGLAPDALRLLEDHAQFGCISLVCTTAEASYPFVFRRRRVVGFPLPCAQLIYCRDLRDLTRFAGPIGRVLAIKGMLWMLVAASQPIDKMVGKFFQNRWPMYFKGPVRPSEGDLAYTEAALFGF